MLLFIFRRLLQGMIVMFVISLISFAIKNNLGDPINQMLGESVSKLERQKLRQELGLNDPFLIQYKNFLVDALHGDLGKSYFFKEPALTVILDKMPATLELVFGATLIIIFISIPAGTYAALKPKSWLTRFILGFSIIGISLPVFLTAIISIYLFAINLGWLPSYGRGEVVHVLGSWKSGFLTLDGFKHLILPSFALASVMLPLFIRLIRSEMLESIQTEYVKFAKAKGLKRSRVYFIHALKNTMLPVLTVGGVQIGTMVAYTILTENVFQWPGMGFMFLEAVNRVDTPLIVAYLIMVGAIFVIVNTIVDLLYGIINPTVNLAGSSS